MYLQIFNASPLGRAATAWYRPLTRPALRESGGQGWAALSGGPQVLRLLAANTPQLGLAQADDSILEYVLCFSVVSLLALPLRVLAVPCRAK